MRNPSITILIFLFCLFQYASPDILTVSKSGNAMYSFITEAVNKAHENDTVAIMDDQVYQECVTIEKKRNLTILSNSPTGKKPSVVYNDKVNVGPKNCKESFIDSTMTYFKNGALRILHSQNIVVQGLIIDANGPYVFGYPNIWGADSTCSGKLYPFQSGNVALSVASSYNVTINNCDIRNAFYGIYMSDTFEPKSVSFIANKYSSSLPWYGMGKMGNHLIENNRIHNNSFGIFLENFSETGCVIRYNLIYENHHSTSVFGKTVKDLTSEGANLPGGAIIFKNRMSTADAIYNNTFWHNYLNFIGHWRPSGQALIFNNIYAQPHIYWSNEPNFQNSFMALDPSFPNRMHNCVYACQMANPDIKLNIIQVYDTSAQKYVVDTVISYQVRIMNQLSEIDTTVMTVPLQLSDKVVNKTISGVKIPGNLIRSSSLNGIPASADLRWLEPKFISTDTSNPDFLVPDWNDSTMVNFIVNRGWRESGVTNRDGSVADLGAIPHQGGLPSTDIRVHPVTFLSNKNIQTLPFKVECSGRYTDFKVEYCKFVTSILDSNAFGGSVRPIQASSIYTISCSGPVMQGFNEISVSGFPANLTSTTGFFEIILSAKDGSGERFTSAPGFIPVNIPANEPPVTCTFTVFPNGDKKLVQVQFIKNSSDADKLTDVSLLYTDGSPVLNIDKKPIFIDTLQNAIKKSAYTAPVVCIDSFEVENTITVLPIVFVANNKITYTSYLLNLAGASPVKGVYKNQLLQTVKSENTSLIIMNLMGKKVSEISLSNYLKGNYPKSLSRGMYLVMQVDQNHKPVQSGMVAKLNIR